MRHAYEEQRISSTYNEMSFDDRLTFLLQREVTERDNTIIFTSQNPVSLWHGLMPNPAIADAILNRIVHAAIRIELKRESMRKKKAAGLDTQTMKE
jgi:DNA replication protein DnaC